MWAGAAEALLDAAEVVAGTRVLDVSTGPGTVAAGALSGVPRLWQWTPSRAWWRLRQTYGLSRTGIKGTPKPLYASGEVGRDLPAGGKRHGDRVHYRPPVGRPQGLTLACAPTSRRSRAPPSSRHRAEDD
jgi:hypothetical protein